MMYAEQESIGRRAARTLFAVVLGRFAGLIILAVTFILVARLLAPANYGAYTVAIGYSALIAALAQFGVASYFDKNIAALSYKRDKKGLARIISNGYAVVVPISLALMLLGAALSGPIASTYLRNSGVQAFTLILVSVDIFFSTLWNTSFSALVGFGRGRQASTSLVLLLLLQLGLGVGLIYAGLGVNGAILGLLIGDALGFVLTTYYTMSAYGYFGAGKICWPDLRGIKETISFSVPLAANNLMVSGVANFATLFLSTFVSAYILGNYGTAIKGLGMMNFVYGNLALVLIQAFSTIIHTTKKKAALNGAYNTAIVYSLLINLPIVVFVGVFSGPLVSLFLTSSYSNAAGYISLIALGTTIAIINSFTLSFFTAAGKVGEVFKISAVSALAQLLGLVILVPYLGAIGAILALYIIGSTVSLLLYIHRLGKVFSVRLQYPKIYRIFASNILLVLLLAPILLVHLNLAELVIGLIAAILLYPPILVLFGCIDGKILSELVLLVGALPIADRALAVMRRYTLVFIRASGREE
ncbi:MAG: polysaccharide biosynthesis protein [Candidatus Micrarchaeota archaeon]|nr:polysaccharide biosynthesis protein [Candidatus Micrarchaeota archaeon]MDE1847573.1 polysaccharide biosynthesis protein [Candidatus Micrarchaeota archaeon]MDE1864290.1 polysaccharide biosynthesis protein [Candidatus Micrarchaeota archaeon]